MRQRMNSAIRLLTALGICLATVRVPLPGPSADASFPCQGHGCGCLTAEACRDQCCCIKPEPVSCCPGEKRESAREDEKSPAGVLSGGWALSPLRCQGVNGFPGGGALLFPPDIRPTIRTVQLPTHYSHPLRSATLHDLCEIEPASPPPRA